MKININYMQLMKMRFYIIIYFIKHYYVSNAIYQSLMKKKQNYARMPTIFQKISE